MLKLQLPFSTATLWCTEKHPGPSLMHQCSEVAHQQTTTRATLGVFTIPKFKLQRITRHGNPQKCEYIKLSIGPPSAWKECALSLTAFIEEAEVDILFNIPVSIGPRLRIRDHVSKHLRSIALQFWNRLSICSTRLLGWNDMVHYTWHLHTKFPTSLLRHCLFQIITSFTCSHQRRINDATGEKSKKNFFTGHHSPLQPQRYGNV